MDKYAEAGGKLARLLGWTELQPYKSYEHGDSWLGHDPDINTDYLLMVPHYTSNSEVTLELILEHDVYPECRGNVVWIKDGDCPWFQYELISDHPDKKTAFLYAAVLALIVKLEREER